MKVIGQLQSPKCKKGVIMMLVISEEGVRHAEAGKG